MTNQQRHDIRRKRKDARRRANLVKRNKAVGTVEDVFRFSRLFKMGTECCKGVRWKASVQMFEIFLFANTARARRRVLDGTWKPTKYNKFTLTERGKARPVDAPTIRDRQVHKTLVRYVLLPLYLPTLISDNGASLKGKGFQFEMREMARQYGRMFRKDGRRGWVISLDISSFFPSANHEMLKSRHARYILDDRLRTLVDTIVIPPDRTEGVPLGVEVSQIEMVAAPTALDNYIRCQLHLPCSGHYMDDYHIFVPSDRDPDEILDKIIAKAEECGFHVNRAKTRIVPLTERFQYCKARFNITETGKVYKSGSQRSWRVARRKIRMFARRKAEGTFNADNARMSIGASVAYFERYNNHNRSLRLARYAYATLHNIGGDIA